MKLKLNDKQKQELREKFLKEWDVTVFHPVDITDWWLSQIEAMFINGGNCTEDFKSDRN